MIVLGIYIGILIIFTFVGVLIKIRITKRKNKKNKKILKHLFDQELFDAEIPYNGPDFVNRFESDVWDFRK